MEERLGHPLFLRDNRAVRLTEAGVQLKLFAQQTIAHYQELTHALNRNGPALCGELRLFCSVTAAYTHLPPILDRFRALYPLVEIKLTTGDPADAVARVVSGSADLGLAGYPDGLPNGIAFAKIDDIPLVLIAPALPCAVRAQIIVPKPDWASIPFVIPEHGPSRKRVEQWFRNRQIGNPQIYATVGGHEAIVSMVALGCGVALLPEVVVDNCPEPVRDRISLLENVSTVEPLEVGLCAQKKRLTSPLVKAFWELLQSPD